MAAVDYFLKFSNDIKGESNDKKHKEEIEIESWSWGETNSGSFSQGGGGGAGKVQMNDFNFTMRVNKASPKLLLACASGEHIKEAILTCRKAGKDQQEYLIVKFTECLVSSFQTGGSSGDVVPVDSIALNFTKIQYEYSPQKADGSLDAKIPVGWNLKENVKV